MNLSVVIHRWLGRPRTAWLLLLVSLVLFGVFVNRGVEQVTLDRTLAPLILDEHIPTWTPADARHLYEVLGPAGRQRYRHFYLSLDFWIPVLTLSLFLMAGLSAVYQRWPRLLWLNLLPIAVWLFDLGENLNHFHMAGTYPTLPAWQLAIGPWLTGIKWVLILGLTATLVAGLLMRGLIQLANR